MWGVWRHCWRDGREHQAQGLWDDNKGSNDQRPHFNGSQTRTIFAFCTKEGPYSDHCWPSCPHKWTRSFACLLLGDVNKPATASRPNMHSTKRKFNALIQGIGNKPSTPGKPSDTPHGNLPSTPRSSVGTPTSNKTSDSDLKRRRTGVPGSTPPVSGSKSTAGGMLKKWSDKTSSPTPPAQPKYCPSDRKELLRRLATFQDLTDWAPKPDRVSEIEWVKRGWVCQGKERVRCALCNKELVIKLNKKEVDGKEVSVLVPSEIGEFAYPVCFRPPTNEVPEEALVNKYVELIVESHGEDCLWRKRGCDGKAPLSFSLIQN